MSEFIRRSARETKLATELVSRINWKSVEEEYKRRAAAKSRTKRPFACRSVEGIAAHEEPGRHNGSLRMLAGSDQRALVKRVQEVRLAIAKQRKGAGEII
jgi:hypothetical protein